MGEMRLCEYDKWDATKKEFVSGFVGKFHCWGSNYEEFENGPGNYTVAIIETLEGKIEEVVPSRVRFNPAPPQPDGDCYGCGLDRTHNEIDALRARETEARGLLEKAHQRIVMANSPIDPYVLARDIRAWLDGGKEEG